MNPASIPISDYVLTILAAVAVAVVLTVAAAWLIDHALLPVLRGLVPDGWAQRRWPAQGRHKESSAQLEVGRPGPADHREPAPPRPDRGSVPAGPAPDHRPGPGRSDQHCDPAVSHHRSDDDAGGWHRLDGDYDTATLRVLQELNAEHPVPAHEPPDVPGPDSGTARPDARTREGEPPGPGTAIDQLDALIEQYRQNTIADPRLGDWIRDALGADSVRSYMERMEATLRTATA